MGKAEREAAAENPGFLDGCLDDYRHRFERGEYEFAVLALRTCASFGLPLPEWLEGEACAAMEFYFRNGGSKGQGKGGGHLVRSRRARKDIIRYHETEKQLARGLTRAEAFEKASIALRSTLSRGSSGTIEESYDKIAPLYRKARAKPGRKPRATKSPD